MSALEHYLQRHYLNVSKFAQHCHIDETTLHAWIRLQLVPQASYVVNGHGVISSEVFGEIAAPDTTPGHYFHPAHKVWLERAQAAIRLAGIAAAPAMLKDTFTANFSLALADLNLSTWRLPDSFADDGTALPAGLNERCAGAWFHFLKGTFGLCVADPVSEAAIARKLVLQDKLNCLSNEGQRTDYSAAEAQAVLDCIVEFDQAVMWFSPAEYPRSSRKRLIDDLKPRMLALLGG